MRRLWSRCVPNTVYDAAALKPSQVKHCIVIFVDEAFTSQRCATCKAPLVRVDRCRDELCPNCGLIARDFNSAKNIRARAVGAILSTSVGDYLVAGAGKPAVPTVSKRDAVVMDRRDFQAQWKAGGDRALLINRFKSGALRLEKECAPRKLRGVAAGPAGVPVAAPPCRMFRQYVRLGPAADVGVPLVGLPAAPEAADTRGDAMPAPPAHSDTGSNHSALLSPRPTGNA